MQAEKGMRACKPWANRRVTASKAGHEKPGVETPSSRIGTDTEWMSAALLKAPEVVQEVVDGDAAVIRAGEGAVVHVRREQAYLEGV